MFFVCVFWIKNVYKGSFSTSWDTCVKKLYNVGAYQKHNETVMTTSSNAIVGLIITNVGEKKKILQCKILEWDVIISLPVIVLNNMCSWH